MTTTKDTMTALRSMLEAERDKNSVIEGDGASSDIAEGDELVHFKNGIEYGYKYDHEAATNRLIGIVEHELLQAETAAKTLRGCLPAKNTPASKDDR